jgi:hypothetical protein
MPGTLSTTCDANAHSSWSADVAYHTLLEELGGALLEIATDRRIHHNARVHLLHCMLGADDDRDAHVERIYRLALTYRNALLDFRPGQEMPRHDELDGAIRDAVVSALRATARIVDAFADSLVEGGRHGQA